MTKTTAYVAVLIVAGLALISFLPGNAVEKLSNLGVSLLAAAIVMATQLKKNELAIIRWVILGLIVLCIVVLVISRVVT
jgi:hypothetical protein